MTHRLARVQGLPGAEPDVPLVVARPVAEACPERTDLVRPGDQVRDAAHRVVACRALGRLSTP